jgi:hypothetical protein
MSPLRRKLVLGLTGLAGIAILALMASAATGFSTWPWQTSQAYADGELGLRIGATKLEVWNRILELQREGVLVPGAGRNNNSRASTTEFTQVDSLDWWSFPIPPCCRCSLDLTFEDESLASFQGHCNYAPEGP